MKLIWSCIFLGALFSSGYAPAKDIHHEIARQEWNQKSTTETPIGTFHAGYHDKCVRMIDGRPIDPNETITGSDGNMYRLAKFENEVRPLASCVEPRQAIGWRRFVRHRSSVVHKHLARMETKKYKVEIGETLWGISKKMHLKNWKVLAALNHMSRWRANHIRYGQTILVPKPFAETRLGKAEAVKKLLEEKNKELKKEAGKEKESEAVIQAKIASFKKEIAGLRDKLNSAVIAKLELGHQITQIRADNVGLSDQNSKLSATVESLRDEASVLRWWRTVLAAIVIAFVVIFVTLWIVSRRWWL